MLTIERTLVALLWLSCCTLGLPQARRDAGCTVKTQRKPWENLTDTERVSYINATICLINAPPKAGIKGAKSRWDELHYVHVAQSDYIHFTGSFLPWHRYYLKVHEALLQDECGYKGAMPYWNEVADVNNFKNAAVFDPKTGFGGDGTAPYRCIADGPFANLTLRFTGDLTTVDYCVMRSLNECPFEGAAQPILDNCLAQKTYEDAWRCIEARPHAAGHAGVGGIMVNTKLSPGDPIFYLHHTWLDRLFWQWQMQRPEVRLKEISGVNIPPSTLPPFLSGSNATFIPPVDPACSARVGGSLPPFLNPNATNPNITNPPIGGSQNPFAGSAPGGGIVLPFAIPKPFPALTNYFNDAGNVTTLGHTLFSWNLLPNSTIGDILDLNHPVNCVEYL